MNGPPARYHKPRQHARDPMAPRTPHRGLATHSRSHATAYASPRPAATASVPVMDADPDRDLLPLFPEHSSVRPDGELAIGGVGVRELAERFGTPAYIVDELGLRNQAGRFKDGLAARHPASEVVFASKSLPCLAVYKTFAAAGLSIDVAGAGELVMALAAGVSPARMYLHGNAKTTAELTMALDAGVATVVVDNFDDIDRLEQLATPARPQPVLIRIIPGVAPETHESQSTGGADSK